MDKLIVNVDGNVSLACPNPSAILHIPSEMFRIFPEYQVQDADTKRNVLNELKKWIKSEEAQLDNIVENQDNTQSTAFLSREEFRNIAVKHGVDYNVAIGLYWDVKNAAHL